MTSSSGRVDPGFEPLRQEFEASFEQRGERGGAVAVWVDGDMVVDIWGGVADGADTPWRRDTLVCGYSVGKGLVALCVNLLADRGEIDVDRPVADYWPTFSRHGKDRMTVASLLRHEAGLIGPRRVLEAPESHDWDTVCEALADSEPWWEPGTRQGYHALTFGHLAGELVRRATGTPLRDFLKAEVTGPMDADVQLGIEDPTVLARCADMFTPDQQTPVPPGVPSPPVASLDQHFFAPLVVALGHLRHADVNSEEFRRAELPSVNVHATARGLGQIYQRLLDGDLLSASALQRATEASEMPNDWDAVLSPASSFAAPRHRWGLGFQVSVGEMFGPSPGTFGHGGASGAMAFADPTKKVVFAYTTNAHQGPSAQRRNKLIESAYQCIGAR